MPCSLLSQILIAVKNGSEYVGGKVILTCCHMYRYAGSLDGGSELLQDVDGMLRCDPGEDLLMVSSCCSSFPKSGHTTSQALSFLLRFLSSIGFIAMLDLSRHKGLKMVQGKGMEGMIESRAWR